MFWQSVIEYLAVAMVVVACRGGATSTSIPSPAPQTSDQSAYVSSVTHVGDRVVELRVESPSVGPALVRLILPEGFDQQASKRWPVLFMYHGATSSPTDWKDIEASPAMEMLSDVLVVMPEAGRVGFYSNWWNGGAGGQPAWETFHMNEIPAILERDWRASDARAALGVSMGGYGAFEYAAREPGFLRAVASISGLLSPTSKPDEVVGLLQYLGADAYDLWGDPITDAANWAAHDPSRNAAALAGTRLFISYGDGNPGNLDPADSTFDRVEAWIGAENDVMVHQLEVLGIPATVDAYGAGTHSTPYFVREFNRAIPMLSAALR